VELFRVLIFDTLGDIQNILSEDIIELIKTRIDNNVSDFLDKALQLDEFYIQSELRAQKCGDLYIPYLAPKCEFLSIGFV
jgi:hypothetical protein